MKLSDVLFAELAGWDVVKQARSLLASGRVLSSSWEPPLLRGTVLEGPTSYRAGLKIKSASDAENLCTCRDARQRGIICAHSIAVGLLHVRSLEPATAVTATKAAEAAKPMRKTPVKAIRRLPPGAEGERLELCFILPPNFDQAAMKGRVMLVAEGSWRNGRVPLTALPPNVHFVLDHQDASLLDALEALNDGDTPGMLMLTAAQFTELLPKWVGHPNVTLGKSQAVEISNEPLRQTVQATLEANGEIVMKMAGANSACVIPGATSWTYKDFTLRPLAFPADLTGMLTSPVRIPRSRIPQFLSIDWPKLTAHCEVRANFALSDFILEAASPRFQLHLAGGLAMLDASLTCYYGEKEVTPGVAAPDDALWLPDPKSPTRYSTRNYEAEQAALARLLKYGFSSPDAKAVCQLRDQNRVLSFFAKEYPRMEKEWKVSLEERLERSTEKNLERIEPRFQITPSGEQWFDLSVSYDTSGGERFDPAEIHRLLRSGQSHTRLKNGKFALMDTGAVEELQEVLLDCAPQQHATGYRLHNAQAGFLDAAVQGHAGWKMQAPESWANRAAQQRGDVKLEAPPLGELDSVLRPYQKAGVAWLQFLRVNNFGGILADEMGLGKTLQVLALIQSLRASKQLTGPVLVVCPTSLVFNWVAEAAKFAAGLRVLALHGPQRHESFAKMAEHDLIVTSYALLRRDAEAYRGMEFDTVVLDEAQHIKNRQTQNAQAVKAIHARNRLVLTGTPIENSVLDLWSIFDFLMPGYLGTAQDFRDRYEQPIIRDKNSAVQSRLARRLRPFLLRRLKREVAADLPEKIEQVSFCELNKEQRALYQQVLAASRKEVFESNEVSGGGANRMVVLTALLRLRQICCDARLLTAKLESSEPGKANQETSGKVELFGELLEAVLDGGHRVLVFSQFTTMLGLLREQLTAQGVAFCYLDGETKNRGEVVGKFQNDASIPVFLISLKAGGVGLNLTGADTVIHFDPWWNPAVEAQATDRAHRIGQSKVVTSYKLITRDTVEEKILHLQTRKRALILGMLGGEEQLTEALSWEEIQDLLAG